MSISTGKISVCLTILLLIAVLWGEAIGSGSWGETIGPVSARVDRADSDRGLTVRSRPSPSSRAVGHLSVGKRIRGHNTFSNGWMQIEGPFAQGWVPMDYLEPVGGRAVVTGVDQPDRCLRIRTGPGTSYNQVGCTEMGEMLHLTGVWSDNNWAEVQEPVSGWVYAPQIRSDLKPDSASTSGLAGRPPPRRFPEYRYDGNERPRRYSYPYRGRRPGYRRYPPNRYRGGPPPYRSGVSINAGPVGVSVGGRGVGVRVPGVGVSVGRGGGVRVRIGP